MPRLNRVTVIVLVGGGALGAAGVVGQFVLEWQVFGLLFLLVGLGCVGWASDRLDVLVGGPAGRWEKRRRELERVGSALRDVVEQRAAGEISTEEFERGRALLSFELASLATRPRPRLDDLTVSFMAGGGILTLSAVVFGLTGHMSWDLAEDVLLGGALSVYVALRRLGFLSRPRATPAEEHRHAAEERRRALEAVAAALRDLDRQRDAGALSPEEFERQRAEILRRL